MKKSTEEALDIVIAAAIGVLAGTAAGMAAGLKSKKLRSIFTRVKPEETDPSELRTEESEDIFEEE